MKTTIITLTGPSCAGKSTLEKMLKEEGMESLISTTTREPRAGEIDGVHYNFVTREEFLEMRRYGNLIEDVTFGENFYGIAVKDVDAVIAKNKPAVVVVEPNGRNQIIEYGKTFWDIYSVFVDNPSEVIAERFLWRFQSELASCEFMAYDSVMDSYAKRLAVMMEDEQRWRDEAYEGRSGFYPYDLLVHEFNAKNKEDIVRQVCNLIASKEWRKKAA